MTAEQRKFVDEVILPKLVSMAIDCTLPMDMTELSSYHFDEEAKEFNQANRQHFMEQNAYEYLCETDEDDEDYLSIPDQVKAIQNYKGNEYDMIDNIDGVYVVERFEYSFTVETFLDQITPPYDE